MDDYDWLLFFTVQILRFLSMFLSLSFLSKAPLLLKFGWKKEDEKKMRKGMNYFVLGIGFFIVFFKLWSVK